MLEKFLNKKVMICFANYAIAIANNIGGVKNSRREGIVTEISNDFIELDHDEVIAIKYISTIKCL